jgi:pimeloyl-ACP methyl ester carboxylesterase
MERFDSRSFVLVHGAWHGGWVWRDVIGRLRNLGHKVTAPTLTGLGERYHTGNETADLKTHADDVIAHIEMENLYHVTLVGWSYGGMVVTAVLARIPERIKDVIYLDAFVPEGGKALVDYMPPDGKAILDTLKAENLPLPPLPLPAFGVTDSAIVAFIEPRLRPQPWRSFYEAVTTAKDTHAIRFSYIVCTGYGETPFTSRRAAIEADPRFHVIELKGDHLCMLTAPVETVAALISASP